jgi:hypothetical protein
MKVRQLLEELSNLPLSSRDKEVYIDVEGDEYVEMELVPIVEPNDEDKVIGYVICEAKPDLVFPIDKKDLH